MKKIVSIVAIIVCIVAIGIAIKIHVFDKQENNTQTNTNANESVIQNQDNQVENEASQMQEDANTIKLSFQGNEIIVRMEENITATGFLNLLPATMVFEDFQNTEKISRLEEPLATNRMISEMTPVTGDVCYYGPWNNIAIFYQDASSATNLYKIGTVIQGIEYVSQIQNGTEITIEK